MLRTKKDVDNHVQMLSRKITSSHDMSLKGLTIAKLYFEVCDLQSAKKHVQQYLTVRENSSLALKLNGQILQQLNCNTDALKNFKLALEHDSSQIDLIPIICGLIAKIVPFDPEVARYWLKKCELHFPLSNQVKLLRAKLQDNNGSILLSNALRSSDTGDNIVSERPLDDQNISIGNISTESLMYSTPRVFPPNHVGSGSSSSKLNGVTDDIIQLGRRFTARPSPERLAGRIKQLETYQEGMYNALYDQNCNIIQNQRDFRDELRVIKDNFVDIKDELIGIRKLIHSKFEESGGKYSESSNATSTAAAVAAATTSALLAQQQQQLMLMQHITMAATANNSVSKNNFGSSIGAPPNLPSSINFPTSLYHQSTYNNIAGNTFETPSSWEMGVLSPYLTNLQSNSLFSASMPHTGNSDASCDKEGILLKSGVATSGIHIQSDSSICTSGETQYRMSMPQGHTVISKSPFNNDGCKDLRSALDSDSLLSSIPAPLHSAVINKSLSKSADKNCSNGTVRCRKASTSSNKSCDISNDDDPCPDFKAIIPLPEEVELVTGEENERVLFEERCKLFRFVDKEWKERGTGQMKILRNNDTKKSRVLMRRDQTHKICANHFILNEMNIDTMKSNKKAVTWCANDYYDEKFNVENFCARFKTSEIANQFRNVFKDAAKIQHLTNQKPKENSWQCLKCFVINDINVTSCSECKIRKSQEPSTCTVSVSNNLFKFRDAKLDISGLLTDNKSMLNSFESCKPSKGSWECSGCLLINNAETNSCAACQKMKLTESSENTNFGSGRFQFDSAKPSFINSGFQFGQPNTTVVSVASIDSSFFSSPSVTSSAITFGGFSFKSTPVVSVSKELVENKKLEKDKPCTVFANLNLLVQDQPINKTTSELVLESSKSSLKSSDDSVSKTENEDEHDPMPDFIPIIPLPEKVDVVTGEENEVVIYEDRCKLFRYIDKQWKERGIGQLKILKHKRNNSFRLIMRRDQTHKVCLNHLITSEVKVDIMKQNDKAVTWVANDFSDGTICLEKLCARFKTVEQCIAFKNVFNNVELDKVNKSTVIRSGEEAEDITKNILFSDEKVKFMKIKRNKWIEMNSGKIQLVREHDSDVSCKLEIYEQDNVTILEHYLSDNISTFNVLKDCNNTITLHNSANSESLALKFIDSAQIPIFLALFNVSNNVRVTSDSFPIESIVSFEDSSDETIIKECELSFENQSLKLGTEVEAEVVTKQILAVKQIHILTLSGNTVGVEGAKAIGRSLETRKEFRRAHWKDMFTGRMKTEIPQALKMLSNGVMTAQARLVELDLSDNALGPIGIEGIRDLIVSPACYSLQELRLNNTGCGVTGGKLLAELLLKCFHNSKLVGHPLALKVFVLGRSRQENDGAKALAHVFKLMGSLEEIIMPQNGICYEGITALAEALVENKNLRILNLSDNTLTFEGSQSLANVLPKLAKLTHLNLSDCLLRTSGAKVIANALASNHVLLEVMNFDYNEIGLTGGLEVVSSLSNKSKLTSLTMIGNCFGAKGLSFIKNKLEMLGKYNVTEYSENNEEPEDDDCSSATNNLCSNIFESTKVVTNNSDMTNISKTSSSATTTSQSTNLIFGKHTPNVQKDTVSSTFSNVISDGSFNTVFGSSNNVQASFSSLATQSSNSAFQFNISKESTENFKFSGVVNPVFGTKPKEMENSDDYVEEEGHDPQFEPIVPLPEIVEVKTGEEDEKIIFMSRAKVFRYESDSKEWKERGVGEIKILKHLKHRSKYRILLRRDQIHKLACNCLISADTDLKSMSSSENALCWYAMDLSEEKAKLEQLAVRFKNSEIKEQFREAFEACRADIKDSQSNMPDDEYDDDDEQVYDESRIVMFSEKCRFRIIDGDNSVSDEDDMNDIMLNIVYDVEIEEYRLEGLRFDESLCFSSRLTRLKSSEDSMKFYWTAVDLFSQDPSVKKTFCVSDFESPQFAETFHGVYYEILNNMGYEDSVDGESCQDGADEAN